MVKIGKKFAWAIIAIFMAVVFVFSACTPKDDGGKGEGGNKPGEEYTLECPDGYRQITFYWNRNTGDYSDCDIWMWPVGGDGVALTFHECEYGAKVIYNVPAETEKVGFIVRTNCSAPGFAVWDGVRKDGTDTDRFVTLRGKFTEIYLKQGDANAYESSDGGKTLKLLRYIVLADMLNASRIKVTMSDDSVKLNKLEGVKITNSAGKSVEIDYITNKNEIVMKEALSVEEAYTLHIDEYDDVGVVPSTYFSSKEFEEKYTYDGELGVEIGESKVTFRIWAPTASRVLLNLYNDGYWGDSIMHYDLERGDKGVWTFVGDRYDASGSEQFVDYYYTYSVTTSVGTQEAVDPYARSTGINGGRGMILDLDATDPEGWTNEPFTAYAGGYAVNNYTDANIWEIHVRDFSNMNEQSQYKGKYLAFTETGLKNSAGVPVGVDYLKELGVTHVHLLPSYDYASVDETSDGQFNWGYDPENYNVPEGSYATDAEDGRVRVNEYKQMVQALHNEGIGVIMDVVYNHTFSAESNLNKVVPYYYYRYTSSGALSNGSGCGNETASERTMVRKYIVDSVTYWQNEYNLDGFRFDLMGLHDITTMKLLEEKVHATNPHALIYGEGWTGGTSTLSGSEQSTLANIEKLNEGKVNGVAMFNDAIRDGVKGSVFNIGDTGFATGAKASYLDRVLFGVQGGYNNGKFNGNYNPGWTSSSPTNVINYVSAHDNNTLWDRICYVYGTDEATLNDRLAMNRLSAAIIQTSLGVPFMQAGEEMLRTKTNADGTYNENSYNAPDQVNNLKWEELTADSEQYKMMQYYKGLIAFRKATPVLRLAEINANTCQLVGQADGACVAFTITSGNEQLLIVYNAETTAKSITLPAGNWDLYINGTTAGTTAIATGLTGTQSISAISCYVFKKA